MREKLFTLSRKQRDDLERRYKQTAERRISERIQAILLLDAGHNREQVARILHLNPKTITRWLRIFVHHGIDTLCTLHSGGNDANLTPPEQAELIIWLDAGVRSTKEAIAWVETTFQVSYTESGMRKLLQRLGYRYKKPVPVPAKANPDHQLAWLDQYLEKKAS
jgi:transposase